ncbi:MAG: DEAD/DEAH box helicase [Candidatus Thorarchaeota archaeon]|nr:DEAD/DEAH box helicase [Candidatus Thorarchaeota archaeon]
MPVLHCLKCGSKLNISQKGRIWTVRCSHCDAELKRKGGDLFDAYEAYSEAIKSGKIGGSTPKRKTWKRKSRSRSSRRRKKTGKERVQSLEEVQKLIKEGGAEIDELPRGLEDLARRGHDYLVTYRHMDETDAEYGCYIKDIKLPSRLKELLRKRGIERLYKFQELCYNLIMDGHDVVISAPTAQGKTEGFILPIMKKLLINIRDAVMNPGVRTLLVYPTKALARDQYEKISAMCDASGLSAAIFDGDVSQHKRRKIYSNPPDIMLTNPDILHYHLGWKRSRLVPLLETVDFVVLDEIHLYSGSMGANLFYILKRLALTCGDFQKIGASATIANPKEFAELIFDTNVKLVASESAKRGPIHFMMYYPGERSKYSMIVDIVDKLQQGDFKTLVFGNTHTEAELLNMLINDSGHKSMVHRAGLSKKYRNDVEEDFKSGDLPIIVSTPTLELGVDIGDLDSVVSMITSITRLTQRIGRAGRKGQESVAVLALRDNDPISSFYRHQPEKYFADIDAAYMEPENEVVGYFQLIAAAMSGKLNVSHFPGQEDILDELEQEGILSVIENGEVRVADYERARKEWRGYSIRGIGDTVQIKSGRKTIGRRSMPMAAQELHPGSIYLHGGDNYKSVEFRYTSGLGRARVVQIDEKNVYTKPLYVTMPRIVEINEHQDLLGMDVVYCDLKMKQTVDGYVKKETGSGDIIDVTQLQDPLVYTYKTKGFAFTAPEPDIAVDKYLSGEFRNAEGPKMGPADLYGGAFHALEHVVIESSDMLTGGSTREIGGVSMGDSGIIFVYDGCPGGNGASKLLFTRLQEALKRSETILNKCDCDTIDGCPLCTYSYQCGNNNSPLFKQGALESVRQVLAGTNTQVDTEGYRGYEPLV